MIGYTNLDDLGYELTGRNPHIAPQLMEIQLDYMWDVKTIARRAVNRIAP